MERRSDVIDAEAPKPVKPVKPVKTVTSVTSVTSVTLYPRTRYVTAFLLVLALGLACAHARAQPVPPCSSVGSDQNPAYGPLGDPPEVAIWRDIQINGDAECMGPVSGPMKLVVALAGRFRHSGTLEDIAARIGAISTTEGLVYWSTTKDGWRELISEASALAEPAAGTERPDFTAEDILGGRTLYFAQKDTRSTGVNVYSLTGRPAGPARLSVATTNLTPIRFMVVTFFEPRALLSVHFVERLEPDVWGYYGLAAVRGGRAEGYEKSLVNRAAAFYRHLIGEPPDKMPPLAP